MLIPLLTGTRGALRSAHQHTEAGQAPVLSGWLRWDPIPQLPAGALSVPPSSSWASVHGSGDLMSLDQVTVHKHLWNRWTNVY